MCVHTSVQHSSMCVYTRVCVCEVPGGVEVETLYTQSVVTSTVNCVCVCVCVCVCACIRVYSTVKCVCVQVHVCVRAYECTEQ